MSTVAAGLASRASLFARLTLVTLSLCFGPALAQAQAKSQPVKSEKQAALGQIRGERAGETPAPSTPGTTVSALPGIETAAPSAIGAVANDVGIDCGAFSGGVKVSAQAA